MAIIVSGESGTNSLFGNLMAIGCAAFMPIGFVLLQIAPRYISATEVSLFLLLESIVAPIWVWLVLDEAPSVTTLVGSAVVFALLLYSYQMLKRSGAFNP
jgi:drug/metabolite transporter (DMT)-like permease